MQGSAPSAPSPGEIINQTISGTRKLGPAIGQINLQGMQQGTSAFVNYLNSDGRSMTLDPARAEELQKTINKSEKPLTSATRKLTTAETQLKTAEAKLAAAQANPNTKPGTLAKLQKTVANANSRTSALQTQVNNLKATIDNARTALKTEGPSLSESYRAADPEAYAAIDLAGFFADQLGKISAQGQRYVDSAGAGYESRDIGTNAISAAQTAPVSNVRAQQVSQGLLGENLMAQALQKSLSDGSLNDQAARDAIQAARRGFAARGLAPGNSSLAAELFNRDRYARARQFEDLAFAGGVQAQDLDRQFQNSGGQLTASRSNQDAALTLSLENARLAQQASLANQEDGRFAATISEQNRLAGAQQNLAQLAAASNFIDSKNRAGMESQLGMSSVYSQSNPLFRNLGLGMTFNTQGLGTQSAGAAADIVSGANSAKILAQSGQGASQAAAVGGIAQGVGSLGQGLLSNPNVVSDRRLKTDIKKIGKDPIGLNTYAFRYKGDSTPRTGYMAQDVQKILPEAVEEIEHNGKTRLAIKPRLIGMAIAEHLQDQQRMIFAKGYTVGKGAGL